MCGKFTQMASWKEVYEYANLMGARPNDEVVTYTPMKSVGVVHLDKDGERLVTPMVWGFTDRKLEGRRAVKNMHARGETVHTKTTWSDAFYHRRGITWAKSFNEGKEMMVFDEDGDPTAKTWTQQWTIKPKDGKPIIIGVIYDEFDVGRGPEYEFAQVTVPANAVISPITDRMPLILREEDVELWLGELRAPITEVRELIKTVEFDEAEWDIGPEDPSKKPPTPRKKRKSEIDKPRLF
jgi:putative SOS response-associated peptidase YedK